MKPLDPFDIDLEKTTLIEASAGTGKTYTITTLYCRLVAKGYPVESILVVTFTEAAASELKLRIRARIFNTFTQLSEQSSNIEDDLVRFLSSHEKLSLILQRLQHALNCFDQASVMTIHSFCFKVLKENAFESRSLFDIELVPDRSLFLRQVSFDFFMTHVNNLDKLFLSYLSKLQITPQNFNGSFGQIVSRKDLICKPSDLKFEDIFEEYRETTKKIQDILLTQDNEINELIQNHKGIEKRSYSKKNVPAWLKASCIKLDQQGRDTFFEMTEKGDPLYKFTKTRLGLKTKSQHALPDHKFFDLCEQLLVFYEKFEANLISLKIRFLSFFNTELEKQKKADGICFFDDLVNDLAAALENKDAQNLQTAVRQTYKACLIDEFQDTDPKQYDIFSKLFSSQNIPFFMIGDPKQAIYAFRGGDIFAYLKASFESDQKFTLEKNYRSAPLLVKGINQLFSSTVNPFLYEPIEFLKVFTPKTATNTLVEKEQNIAPLQFCFIQRDGQVPDRSNLDRSNLDRQILDRQGFISKDTASKMIPDIVAKDIISLLQSEKMLISKENNINGSQKISPADIAVLVRTNQQAELIQNALSNLNIPSYLSKTGSVFDSDEAIDLHDILWAVYNPDNKGYIKAALCTSVFNYSSDMMIEFDEQEELFFKWQNQFATYKEIWDSRGFVSMIMALFHSEQAFLKENLSLCERGLTNFYHLIELISQACLKQQLSPYYLMKWYARQLFKDLRDEFSDELRLESDKKAIAIVTIHKSKGLEYPIVYLLYLWEGVRKPSDPNILFHDPDKDHRLTLDLGSKDLENSKIYFQKEEAAEQRRLLYVALTRASSMCKIFWGGFKSVETSALGSMLHQGGCKDDESMINDLKNLIALADKSILLQLYLYEAPERFVDTTDLQQTMLSAKETTQKIKASWKMSSFSALTLSLHAKILQSQEEPEADGPDKDGPDTIITLADFPKGAGSGDFFHSIFETLDFTGNSKEILKLVQSKFDMFGFIDPDLIQMGETCVKEVLATTLISDTSVGTSGFCLKDIKSYQRFNEMEFLFSAQSFNMRSVQKVFEQSDHKFIKSGYVKKLSQLSAQSFKGFIKGFIDLIIQHEGKWYIIDYKSNYLGDTYDKYSQKAMFDAMSDHHYFLQYHIYVVALHRYLGLRLKNYDYDTHFGGVFYLFIRGMHPKFGSRYGVFYDRPTKESIKHGLL